MEGLESAAAGVAGFAILALCFVGGFAETAREAISMEALLGPDSDPSLPGTIRGIVICFFFTGVIDAFVALALLAFVVSRIASPKDCPLATAAAVSAAIFRLAYACVLVSCLNGLAQVPQLLLHLREKAEESEAGRSGMTEMLVRQLWESFHLGFNGVALGLFGIHLALLAVPLWTSARTSSSSSSSIFSGTVLPASLAIAGAGYTGDAIGIFLQDKTFGLTKNGCFIGEVLLMGWLLAIWTSVCWRSSVSSGEQPFLE